MRFIVQRGRVPGRARHRPLRVFLKLINFCFYRNYIINKYRAQRNVPRRTVVLFDRACPLCRMEMSRLKKRDRHARLQLIDITDPNFDQRQWGFSRGALSAALHVLTPRGEWLIGMPAIRHVYRQAGLGWFMAPSGWPLLSPLADFLYRHLAANRFAVSRWLGLQASPPSCCEKYCVNTNPHRGGPRHD